MLGMTPHFTIRVWAALDKRMDELDWALGLPRRREVVAEIEVDGTEDYELTIGGHRGLDLVPQKMLTGGGYLRDYRELARIMESDD